MESAMSLSHHHEYKPKDKCSCGAENALFDFIPDTIYGISIQKPCCIHDHRYEIGGDENDKVQADREFLMNMLYVIEEYANNKPIRGDYSSWRAFAFARTKWHATPIYLARTRALKYYEAVVRMGSGSFNWRTN